MASINVNEIAAREEAEFLFRRKQEAERQAARQRELAKQAEIEDLKRREVEIRLQRESEIMMARLRAEEDMAAAKARAQKEAHDAAVAAHFAALEARSPEEKIMAELEALRNQLEAKLSFLDTGYTTLTQKHVTFEQSCPWNNGLDEIKGLIAGLDKKFTQEVTSLRAMATKPARKIVFRANYMMTTTTLPTNGGAHGNVLRVQYSMAPQGSPCGGNSVITVKENDLFELDVPAGHIVALVGAEWLPPTHHRPFVGLGKGITFELLKPYFDM